MTRRASGMTSANAGRSPKPAKWARAGPARGASRRGPCGRPSRPRGRPRAAVISRRGEADRVRVERAGEAAIRGDEDDQALAARARRGADGPRPRTAARSARTSSSFSAVRPRGERRLLGATKLRGSHELHRPRDLLDVADGPDAAPDVALASFTKRGSAILRGIRNRTLREVTSFPAPFRIRNRNRTPGGRGCPVRCRRNRKNTASG